MSGVKCGAVGLLGRLSACFDEGDIGRDVRLREIVGPIIVGRAAGQEQRVVQRIFQVLVGIN